MPKLRAKPARLCLMDTIIDQSLDRLPTSKLPVMRLVLQWRRSFQCQCDSPSSNTSICQGHYEWSDYVWQLAYVPTKRADTLKSMVANIIDDLSRILKYGFRLSPCVEPCLSYTQYLNAKFDISADRLHETMSSQLMPGKKNSNWQLALTSRKLMYKPGDSRWRKSIRQGSSAKPLKDNSSSTVKFSLTLKCSDYTTQRGSAVLEKMLERTKEAAHTVLPNDAPPQDQCAQKHQEMLVDRLVQSPGGSG